MAVPNVLRTVIDFIRKGYPEGVPRQDYIPLLALLHRRLTDEQVVEVVEELKSGDGHPIEADELRSAIQRLTTEPPLESDVERVRNLLAAAGWAVPQL